MADVLVIDDSAMCRELLCRCLEAHGYSAISAATRDAMAAFRDAVPAMIVMDPGAIGSAGWNFLSSVRRGGGNPNLPIVIVTEPAGKQDVLQAANLGVRDYMLKKGFSLQELLTRVARYVEPSKPQSGQRSETAKTTPPLLPTEKQAATAQSPVSAQPPVTAISPPRSRLGPMKLTDAADEIGVKRLSRTKTLERLASAPVKTLPGVVAELVSLVNSSRGTVVDVADTLRRDPMMTARILRVANSAAFTSQRARISTVQDAVKNIGVAGVRNMVVNVGVFDAFASGATGGLRFTRVWQHCIGVAMLMEKLAPKNGAHAPSGSDYLVGLCHDLADIVLRQHFAVQYEAIDTIITKTGATLRAAEQAVFGMRYSELTSQLLARLKLPPTITTPIEEFYSRPEKKEAADTGSPLSRRLRAVNIYVHGLLLSPDAQQPVTPLTRAELASTFGNASIEAGDDDILRAEAMATASMLAGLSSSQTQQMCEPLVEQRPIRVNYCRHGDYMSFDPLMAFLRLTAQEVQLLPSLEKAESQSVQEGDVLIVAGPRAAGSDALNWEIGHMRRLLSGRPIPALHLGDPLPDKSEVAQDGIIVKSLPLNIESLGQFLAQQTETSLARAA